MNIHDINLLHRFVGAVEGVALTLPESAQSLIYDYLEVVNGILDKEEKGGVE